MTETLLARSPQGSGVRSPFLGLPVDPLVDTFVTQMPAGVIGVLLASLGTDDLRRPVPLKPFSNRLKKFWFFEARTATGVMETLLSP
mgnify:CR=1 FL=1